MRAPPPAAPHRAPDRQRAHADPVRRGPTRSASRPRRKPRLPHPACAMRQRHVEPRRPPPPAEETPQRCGRSCSSGQPAPASMARQLARLGPATGAGFKASASPEPVPAKKGHGLQNPPSVRRALRSALQTDTAWTQAPWDEAGAPSGPAASEAALPEPERSGPRRPRDHRLPPPGRGSATGPVHQSALRSCQNWTAGNPPRSRRESPGELRRYGRRSRGETVRAAPTMAGQSAQANG